MTYLTLDLETDGLDPTQIWCCVVNDDVFTDAHSFNTFMEHVQESTEIYAHNGIAFDYPVLERLWGTDLSRFTLRDTLVMSRLANPSREGGHSLSNWGEKLGFGKGEYSDWEGGLTAEMLEYCKQDVRVTQRVIVQLKKELEGFSDHSIELEHEVQTAIAKQIKNGWLLDQALCFDLLAALKERKNDLEDEVRETFVPLPEQGREIIPKVKKDGSFSVVGLKFMGDDWMDIAGTFSRVDYPVFNLGSRRQIGKHLMHYGWKPSNFTETGQPIVDETTLEGLDIPQAQLIAEYLMVQKRIAQIQSWLDAVKDDGRVHGYVNSNGAVTGRMTHSSPNMAQVPATGKPYGVECRSCWTVPKGYKIVGIDASGLELRMLAHYMNSEDYTAEILDGDVHTANQNAAGLSTRNEAKTFIYAFLYGAGDAKIGSIVGGGAKAGKKLKEQFLANTPALAQLKDEVACKASQGFLKGLDGRKIAIRSEHAALNSLLQGAGAIVMKKALTLLADYAILWNIEHRFIGNIHDEFQVEVAEKDADKFGHLAVSCIRAAGKYYNLRCPLDGEYKIGDTWAQTH